MDNTKSVVIFIISNAVFKDAFGLSCYTCISKSESGCKHRQLLDECKYGEICMTLRYKEKVSIDKEVKMIEKSCYNSRSDCNKECEMRAMFGGVTNCKASCCHENECNKVSAKKEDKIWIGNKRSNSNNSNNASTIQKNNIAVNLLVILPTFLSTWLIGQS